MIGFNGGWNLPVLLAVSVPHGSSKTTMDITPLNKKQTESANCKYAFSKMRITGNEAIKYLDIYVVAKDVARSLRVSLGASLDCTLMTPAFDPQESTYTKEFLISDLWGGVKRCLLIYYVILQKGGLRDDGNNSTYRIVDQEDGRGHDVLSWWPLQFRRLGSERSNDSRQLSARDYQYRESPRRLSDVRKHHSLSGLLSVAGDPAYIRKLFLPAHEDGFLDQMAEGVDGIGVIRRKEVVAA